jgi:hypothetical protein
MLARARFSFHQVYRQRRERLPPIDDSSGCVWTEKLMEGGPGRVVSIHRSPLSLKSAARAEFTRHLETAPAARNGSCRKKTALRKDLSAASPFDARAATP